jgi:hypothetical protein
MRSRGRLSVLAALLALLVLAVPGAGPANAAEPPLTRVRLQLDSTSDWAGLTVGGVQWAARATVLTTPGATLEQFGQGFTLRSSTPATAVVDVLMVAAANAAPVVTVKKGYNGTATGVVTRNNNTPVEVLRVHNDDKTPPNYIVSQPVSSSTMVGEGWTIPDIDPRRLTLAFYYPWYTTGSFSSGMWPDRPSGPFATDKPDQVRAMVDQAGDAGVNGFVVSWNGDAATASRFDLVLEAAAARGGFSVAPYLEVLSAEREGSIDMAVLTEALTAAMARSAHPAFLRVGSRPVLFVFGSWRLTPVQWAELRAAVPGTAPFVVGDSVELAYGFDGFHRYNPNDQTSDELPGLYTKLARTLRWRAQVDPTIPQRLWAATVSPGQNSMWSNPLWGVYRARGQNGERYADTWRAALGSDPEWVMITSWNEWHEATHIAPGVNTGGRALAQTTTWTGTFAG